MWNNIWNGSSPNIMDEAEFYEETPMTESFILDDSIFYEPKMRWNKNTKKTRVRECWVCGEETSDYYSHKWRIQDKGRIANIKCEHCYNEYMGRKNGESI